MSGNEPKGTVEPDHFEKYDALPPRVRRLLQLAHTNYKTIIWTRLTRGTTDERLDQLAKFLWSQRRADILRHYGPTHPELAR